MRGNQRGISTLTSTANACPFGLFVTFFCVYLEVHFSFSFLSCIFCRYFNHEKLQSQCQSANPLQKISLEILNQNSKRILFVLVRLQGLHNIDCSLPPVILICTSTLFVIHLVKPVDDDLIGNVLFLLTPGNSYLFCSLFD